MEELTEKQKEIIQHALGLNRAKKPFRNRFVTGPGSKDFEVLESLEANGCAKRNEHWLTGGDIFFWITEKGAEAVGSELPKD